MRLGSAQQLMTRMDTIHGIQRTLLAFIYDEPLLHPSALHSQRDEKRHRLHRGGDVGAID